MIAEASPNPTVRESDRAGNGDEISTSSQETRSEATGTAEQEARSEATGTSRMPVPADIHIPGEASMKPKTKRAVLHLAEAAWQQMKEQYGAENPDA